MELNRIFNRIKQLRIVSNRLVGHLHAGEYRSIFTGRGIEFDEVREYQEGDDARLIDWNVSSRMNAPFTKTYREEKELTMFLIADFSPSMEYSGDFMRKRDVLVTLSSLFSFAAVSNNDKIGALCFSDRIEEWIPPKKGKKQALRVIRNMLTLKPRSNGSDLGLALRVTQETMKRRGMCIILSDFKTAFPWNVVSIIGKKHDVIAVRICDAIDEQYPPVGRIDLKDPESGDVITAYGNSKHFAKEYRDYWQIHRQKWKLGMRKRGIETLEVTTDEDPAEKLIQFFKRRRKR